MKHRACASILTHFDSARTMIEARLVDRKVCSCCGKSMVGTQLSAAPGFVTRGQRDKVLVWVSEPASRSHSPQGKELLFTVEHDQPSWPAISAGADAGAGEFDRPGF